MNTLRDTSLGNYEKYHNIRKSYKMNIKIVNRSIYSTEHFDEYLCRIRLELRENITIDLYTTCSDKNTIYNDISEIVSEKVDSYKILDIFTREDDTVMSKILDL